MTALPLNFVNYSANQLYPVFPVRDSAISFPIQQGTLIFLLQIPKDMP